MPNRRMTPEPAATLEEAARVVARAQAELDLVREHEGVALEACQRRVGELEARLEVVGAELKVIKDTLDGLGRRQHQGVPLPAGPPGSLKEILAFLDRARRHASGHERAPAWCGMRPL